MTRPIARTIILTDAGASAYSAKLAAYDGTVVGLPALTLDNTLAASSAVTSTVVGAPALFIALYARLAALDRAADLHARRRALSTRLTTLES